jgi:protein TonB
MRSDAVSLDVPVRVHGSKVKDVVLGTTPHTEPFEEQTSTMIIFSHGGVLRMNTHVGVGQMLVLTNLKTRQDAICRVLKVRPNPNLAAYVEVEFTNPQPGYWGVSFPSDDEAPSPKSAAPAPSPVEPAKAEKPAPKISRAPAPLPADAAPAATESKPSEPLPPPAPRFIPSPKPKSTFTLIGSQEDVQPAASATTFLESMRAQISPAPTELPAAPISAPPATLSMTDLRGDEDHGIADNAADAVDTLGAHEHESSFTPAPAAASSQSIFGNLSGDDSLSESKPSTSDTFGARLDSSFGASPIEGAQPRMNWMLVAAGISVLITVIGGGLYFRSRSSDNHESDAKSPAVARQNSQPAPQPAQEIAPQIAPANPAPTTAVAVPAKVQPSTPAPSIVTPSNPAPAPSATFTANPVASAPKPAPFAAAPAATTPPAAKPTASAAATPAAAKPPAPAAATPAATKPNVPMVTTGMMSSALNAHPAQAQRADDSSGAAPVVSDAAASEADSPALSGIATSHAPALAVPIVQPEGPVRIGGDVKEPRLISSVLPVYPLGARQSGVEGDVIVSTTIDKNGSVVGMKVLSGPPMLRQAALDALRRWRYEPSRLNGQPVAVEMQVTIKFRR